MCWRWGKNGVIECLWYCAGCFHETLAPTSLVSEISFTDFGKASPNRILVRFCELHSCLNGTFRSGFISTRHLRLTSLIECPRRARESSESLRNSDTSLSDSNLELDFNSSSLSAILTMVIMLFSKFVSSFCILKSLDLVLDLALLQISGFTLVLLRFLQFSGRLYFPWFYFVFPSLRLL